MRILMVNSFHYLRGGAERCYLDLTDLLSHQGHEVIPFSMAHEQNLPSEYEEHFVSQMDFPTELAKPGLAPKLRVAERTLFSREAKSKIEGLLDVVDPDIAHIHGFIHEMSPSILGPLREVGVPIVQTLHDYKPLCPNTNFVSGGAVCERCKGHRYYNVVRYRCKRDSLPASLLAGLSAYVNRYLGLYEDNVDLFISPSEFLRDKMIEYGARKQIVHIPNFIYLDRFQPRYQPENYFVFVGRLVAVKGVLTLMEAMSRVKDSHLYFAGSGEMEDTLREMAADRGINNVTFLGHLGTSDLVRLVQNARFTVVPSEWYENYSMTVLESLACGTPVVGARIGGIPEQIKDGYNGLLFRPGDAAELAEKMLYLLADPQRSIDMGQNGRRQVESVNSPERHYVQTMQAYRLLQSQEQKVFAL